VRRVTVNGKAVEGNVVPEKALGQVNAIEVTMGQARERI